MPKQQNFLRRRHPVSVVKKGNYMMRGLFFYLTLGIDSIPQVNPNTPIGALALPTSLVSQVNFVQRHATPTLVT